MPVSQKEKLRFTGHGPGGWERPPLRPDPNNKKLKSFYYWESADRPPPGIPEAGPRDLGSLQEANLSGKIPTLFPNLPAYGLTRLSVHVPHFPVYLPAPGCFPRPVE